MTVIVTMMVMIVLIVTVIMMVVAIVMVAMPCLYRDKVGKDNCQRIVYIGLVATIGSNRLFTKGDHANK